MPICRWFSVHSLPADNNRCTLHWGMADTLECLSLSRACFLTIRLPSESVLPPRHWLAGSTRLLERDPLGFGPDTHIHDSTLEEASHGGYGLLAALRLCSRFFVQRRRIVEYFQRAREKYQVYSLPSWINIE